MSLRFANRWLRGQRAARRAGSVLIIVLWVTFGLVALAVYFAHSMTFELRAADNRVASMEADQAIAGAARFVSNILNTAEYPGLPPYMETYQCEAVPVGDATFWLIGRDPAQSLPDQPYFYLVDESSKLNLNADWVTPDVLALLPRMTSDLAANIAAWKGLVGSSSASITGGATDQTYTQLNPAYHCKGAPFESVDELRLVYEATTDILYGEDANQNGVLDSNEPEDMPNGQLDPGIFEYLTVYSQDSTLGIDVTNKVALTDQAGMQSLLEQMLGASRADDIITKVFPAGGGQSGNPTNRPPSNTGGNGGSTTPSFTSLLEFYIQANTLASMTPDEYALIDGDIILDASNPAKGLVNVNTSSEAVLTCVPGIGTDYASTLVAYRESNPDRLDSIAWVAEVLPQANAIQAGPYLTARSYQWTADVAAVGHHDRGYRRVKFVFDMSQGTPSVIYRQDLTGLGWALGQEVRKELELDRQIK